MPSLFHKFGITAEVILKSYSDWSKVLARTTGLCLISVESEVRNCRCGSGRLSVVNLMRMKLQNLSRSTATSITQDKWLTIA